MKDIQVDLCILQARQKTGGTEVRGGESRWGGEWWQRKRYLAPWPQQTWHNWLLISIKSKKVLQSRWGLQIKQIIVYKILELVCLFVNSLTLWPRNLWTKSVEQSFILLFNLSPCLFSTCFMRIYIFLDKKRANLLMLTERSLIHCKVLLYIAQVRLYFGIKVRL